MAKKQPITKDLLSKIDARLGAIEDRLAGIERDEAQDLAADERLADEEEQELDELKKLERLEQEVKRDVAPKPLARITYHDFTKGVIGAFFGIVGHFAFFYGSKIAHDITVGRAHALMVTSLAILVLFIYFSGFRKLKKSRKHHLIPWRVLVIYLTAHAVIFFVLFLFGKISFSMPGVEIYKNVATVSLLAVMGAATADLIGGE